MKYLIIIEKAAANYSAYVPDLPGCISTGSTVEQVRENLREAIDFHLAQLRADGLPVPQPTTISDYVEAQVA